MRKRFDNDDPWAMVNLANKVSREEAQVQAALDRRALQSSTKGREKAKAELRPDRFSRFKVSICGNQIKREQESGFTLDQIKALPLGLQRDAVGPYVWGYSAV